MRLYQIWTNSFVSSCFWGTFVATDPLHWWNFRWFLSPSQQRYNKYSNKHCWGAGCVRPSWWTASSQVADITRVLAHCLDLCTIVDGCQAGFKGWVCPVSTLHRYHWYHVSDVSFRVICHLHQFWIIHHTKWISCLPNFLPLWLYVITLWQPSLTETFL